MKTRNEIYQGEGAKLLRFITTYHTLRYDQVLQLFSRHEQSIKSLITSLIKGASFTIKSMTFFVTASSLLRILTML